MKTTKLSKLTQLVLSVVGKLVATFTAYKIKYWDLESKCEFKFKFIHKRNRIYMIFNFSYMFNATHH